MKTNLDKLFKASETLQKEGVDFAIDDKTSFKVRHFNSSNPRIKAAMATHYKPYARQMELGSIAQEKSDEITRKLFVDVCLVSWQGVEDDKGKAIDFTKENALKIFKDLPALFDTLWKYANDFTNYKEDLGNS